MEAWSVPQTPQNMSDGVPLLKNFVDHLTDTSIDTKNNVKKFLNGSFSANARLLLTLGQRHLGVPGTYAEEPPFPDLQLLLQAYKIKIEGKGNLCLRVANSSLAVMHHRILATASILRMIQTNLPPKPLSSHNSPLLPTTSFSTHW